MMIASRSVSPETGKLFPNYDTHGDRVVDAIRLTIDLYVPTDSQEALIRQMRTFHRACAGLRGVPLPGRGLSAVSQAGKSRTITEFARRTNAVEPANPNRVLHIELTERITVKMLYQRMLVSIGDPEALGKYSLEILRQRCAELLPAVGCELIAVDEVQLLGKATSDNYDVADALKSLLDEGIVSVLFAGNEKAKDIFEVNNQLRGRLGVPLDLKPADPKSTTEIASLRRFLDELDERLTASKLIGRSELRSADTLRRLGKAGGGHVGRIARIVGAGLEHACARGAERIEHYDLSYAVAHLAQPAGWCGKNPFPEPEHW